MEFIFLFFIGIIFLNKNHIYCDEDISDNENDYSQVQGMDVNKIALTDDLSQYTQCKNVVTIDNEIMRICQNNSICRLLPGPQGYLQVFCDCSNTVTETYYFMGPTCETKMPITYSQNVSGLLNTCWLEDLFGKNSWKNDFSRVGPLV